MNEFFDGLPNENGADELDTDIIFPQDNSDIDSSSTPTFYQKQKDMNKNLKIDKVINEKYRKKCRKMKKVMKALIFENAALCDEVAQLQEKILIGKEERRYFVKKLLHLQAQRENVVQSLPKLNSGMLANHSFNNVITQSVVLPISDSIDRIKKKVPSKKKSTKDTIEDNLKAKSIRKKASVDKKFVQLIPLDSTGRPIFPINLGDLTLHSLGEIVSDRPGFHTEDHIFPVGFCSSRLYGSIKNPSQHCLYTCTIMDGNTGPRFEIVPEDNTEKPILGNTPNECHSTLLRTINEIYGKEILSQEGQGADFFGLTHPTIQNLVQSCAGARKCSLYRWVKFEVCKNIKIEEGNATDNDPTINFEALQTLLFSLSTSSEEKHNKESSIQELPTSLTVQTTNLQSLLMANIIDNSSR